MKTEDPLAEAFLWYKWINASHFPSVQCVRNPWSGNASTHLLDPYSKEIHNFAWFSWPCRCSHEHWFLVILKSFGFCYHPHNLAVGYLIIFYNCFTLFANWFLSESYHWNHTKKPSRSLKRLRENYHLQLGKAYNRSIAYFTILPRSPWKGEEKAAKTGLGRVVWVIYLLLLCLNWYQF